MSNDFLKTFDEIKLKQKEIFKILQLAIENEEREDNVNAFKNYKDCICKIDEVLEIPVTLPENVDSVRNEWDEACKIIHKIKKARAETLQRIGFLSKKLNVSLERETIDIAEDENGRPWTYTELAEALRKMQINNDEFCLNSLELLFSCEGVSLYHINPNGDVESTMKNAVMRIIKMEKDEKKCLRATYFIQIIKSSSAVNIEVTESENRESTELAYNENAEENSLSSITVDNFDAQNGSSWIYPLIPKLSPCFRTDFGAFIFPDLEPSELGSSFGIIVPKDGKEDEIVLAILEAILHGVVIQSEEGKKFRSQDISENIIRGAHFISLNLIKGAEKTGNFISNSTPYVLSKIKRGSNEDARISNKVQTTVNVTKNVTGVAATATCYIAEKIGSATMSLGRFLAPHIQKHGSTLLSRSLGISKSEAEEKVNGVLTVAAGAVEGFATVYSGLEESAKILGKSLGENSVKIIEHKYGPSAGTVASGTFDTVGNVINLSQNVNYFTPKGFVKKTAKNAGKAIVQTYKPQNVENVISAGSLYPDLSMLKAEVKN